MATKTYFVHVHHVTGKPVGPRAKHIGTPAYGYKTLAVARRYAPTGCIIQERHMDGANDWSGRCVDWN